MQKKCGKYRYEGNLFFLLRIDLTPNGASTTAISIGSKKVRMAYTMINLQNRSGKFPIVFCVSQHIRTSIERIRMLVAGPSKTTATSSLVWSRDDW